ncbi:DUF493 family protein [Pseudodesulfovibrio sp. JC047]|uniref:DUF493 family protein n=1 Tax=Pseudodesulfovibrio sp. JC047 TaxID=2683199 RepID=UPI0013D7084F|nr:DUF493 family protein [Pseudodesulfovibrio sp. JC047]NDV20550.1 DUF493 family protein [Pseudodesulfovibrio sp. JC047]
MTKREQFKQALDGHHEWPCPYIHKFIVPADNFEQFKTLFSKEKLETKQSKTGKYISITMVSTMCSADHVMDVYEKAAEVPGLISL